VLCDGAPQPLPNQGQGLVPRGTLQLAVAPYEWISQPIAGAGECVGKAALDAGVPPVHRSIECGGYRGHSVVAYVHVKAAAHPAIAAGGASDGLNRAWIVETRLKNRAGGARVDTAATADTRRVNPAVTSAGD
jgi:hypothetical protein